MSSQQQAGVPPFPWSILIALYCAITFLMLGIDVALLHLGYAHYNFMAVLPVAFCTVAVFVSLATAFSPWMRRKAWIFGVMTMVVGCVGTVIHLEMGFAHLKVWNMHNLLERLVFNPRPPLAPAALAGTGLLFIFIAVSESWPIPWLNRILARVPIIGKRFREAVAVEVSQQEQPLAAK